jgi:cysteinyl-tRNA synthetase
VKKNNSLEQLVFDVNLGVKVIEDKMANEADKDKKEMYAKMLAKVGEVLAKVGAVDAAKSDETRAELLAVSTEILSSWLDKLEGKNVTDNSIFNQLPRHYEGEFHKDMAALNVNTQISEFNSRTELIIF